VGMDIFVESRNGTRLKPRPETERSSTALAKTNAELGVTSVTVVNPRVKRPYYEP
jgi:hypothetical protein